MGPRGVTAIYFTQRANAAAPHARTRAHLELHPPRPAIHPPTQNYDSTRSPRGWLWAQGYNLNCKKIKQILISSIATALQLLLTFIFISVTSGLIFSFFFFLYTLHSLRVMTSHFMHFCIVKSAWKRILFSPSAPYASVTSSFTVVKKCVQESSRLLQPAESKPPFSNQSHGDYIWSMIWNGLMNPH